MSSSWLHILAKGDAINPNTAQIFHCLNNFYCWVILTDALKFMTLENLSIISAQFDESISGETVSVWTSKKVNQCSTLAKRCLSSKVKIIPSSVSPRPSISEVFVSKVAGPCVFARSSVSNDFRRSLFFLGHRFVLNQAKKLNLLSLSREAVITWTDISCLNQTRNSILTLLQIIFTFL